MAEDAIEEIEIEDIPAGETEIEEEPVGAEVETPEGEEAEDEDEVLISFDGEGDAPSPSEQPDNSVIRELRARDRELSRENRELKRKLELQEQPKKIEVGEKPTLEGCEYDTDKFEAEYEAWQSRKAQAERQNAEAQRAQQQQQEAWNKRVETVDTQIAALKARDFPAALEEVKSAFSDAQQTVLMWAPKDAAKVIYALGKHPQKAAELAKITNPIVLAAELRELEGKLTVTTQRKAPPPPEKIVRGSAPLSPQADKHLERLEKEAERSGDRTKVVAYKRQLKAQAR